MSAHCMRSSGSARCEFQQWNEGQALRLSTEPQSNVLRYDLLRAAQQDKEVRHGT
jgi:hypothetical protein